MEGDFALTRGTPAGALGNLYSHARALPAYLPTTLPISSDLAGNFGVHSGTNPVSNRSAHPGNASVNHPFFVHELGQRVPFVSEEFRAAH